MILDLILKIDSSAPTDTAKELSVIWNEVVGSIVEEMLKYAEPNMGGLHINLREEMALELATFMSFISEKVVSERLDGRLVSEINPEEERAQCFSDVGMSQISETAKICAEHIWLKKYIERWKPKTEAALNKEKSDLKKTKITPQKVEKNHFIPKSYIKKYWSEGQSIYKGVKTADGVKQKIRTPLGGWGFQCNIYSDYLEAYFGLLEGDAAKPIEMVLNVEPLNRPQREALIGFIVIQRLRNPHFMESLEESMSPLVGEEKVNDKAYMRQAYEALYSQNEFYDKLARPILFSRWVVVRSETPDFLLPDTSNVFGSYEDRQYVFMPLTPTDCLVVLPIQVDIPRVVPHYIKATESMVKDISYILYCAVGNEFLTASDATLYLNNDSPKDVMKRVILTLVKITTDDKC